MNPAGNNAVVPIIRPDFIDTSAESIKLVELFTIIPNRLAPVILQPANIVDDKLDPERSTDVMSTEEYVPPWPTITIVMRMGVAAVKFVVSDWATFIVVVPEPAIVALAVDEFGIVTIPVAFDE